MTITKTVDNINDELKRLNTEIGKLPKQSETRLKETTPIKTGNARRNTVLKNGKSIVGDYPYSGRLDDGWSKQAPNGMSKPFDNWIDELP